MDVKQEYPSDYEIAFEQFLSYLYHEEDKEKALDIWEEFGPFPFTNQIEEDNILRWLYSRQIPLPQGLENPSLFQLIHEDLWIGSWNGGVFRYSLATLDWDTLYQPLESLSVQTTEQVLYKDNFVYTAWYNGLRRFNKGNSQWENIPWQGFPGRLRDLTYWKDRWWIATADSGIYYLNDQNEWKLHRELLSCGLAINRLYSRGDSLWIASADRGLWEWKDQELIAWGQGQMNRNVTLVEFTKDALWVGTYGGGVYQLKDREVQQSWNVSNSSLTDNWIISSTSTEDYLFWGTLGGGLCVMKSSGEITPLGINQGLLSMDIAALEWYNDHLYVGSLGGGITEIHEKLIQKRLQNN